ncbi:hypothetical protein Rhe02_89430 [Rhizocola hellebori]|uniref:HTH cro/C1-type domain-containing protein n=1 Tax=Rhizocola hellebori TaxID=1392758 RepID=A0A8J3QHS2_9ACTN|nr:helix-turn-helix transcriptional regulator [Rhizocola hellebori]GIH10876.1 hypothetical protein Rhe02_89430 [Rhizocola hellebori]
MPVTISRATFGARLRHYRMAAGLSLGQLAIAVHYTKGHLSRVELGHKSPSDDLVRLCEAVLGSRGELTRLAAATQRPRPAGDAHARFAADNSASDLTDEVTREPLWPLRNRAVTENGGAGPAELRAMRAIYDNLRAMGQRMSAATMTPPLASHTRMLLKLASQSSSGIRESALALAARFAEYAGWMAQEDGDDAHAAWWTDWACEFAAAGEDHCLVSYGFVRKALIALYQGDAATTVELAQRAQTESISDRVRGLAAQREAQGHALGGDYEQCRRALDRAARFLGRVDTSDPQPVIGTTNVIDPVAMTLGWCLYDLGRPAEAAPVLRREIERIPPQAARARTRYGARLALALAGSGEVDEACAVAAPVLVSYGNLQSATIRADLRNLAGTLNRWHHQRAVAVLMPDLSAALRQRTAA